MDSVTLILSIILIATGLILLLAELFVFSGLLLALAVLAIGTGVALPFIYGDTASGVWVLTGVAVVLPTLVLFAVHYWPRTTWAQRMIQSGPEEDVTIASMPVIAELEMLRGRMGRAVSPLRPSGVADFDGRRIDVLTEGMMVAEGTWVRCIEVKAGRVVVRPVDEPKLSDLENADFS